MTQHTVHSGNGFITYSEVDHTFLFEGNTVEMEFHHYCGPMFMIKHEDGSEEDFCPDDSPRFDSLWKEFEAWQGSKKGIEVLANADKKMGITRDESGCVVNDDCSLNAI